MTKEVNYIWKVDIKREKLDNNTEEKVRDKNKLEGCRRLK